MDLETPVSPDAETQNPAPESAETPEVAAPETAEPEQEAKQEDDPHAKAIKRMERRIDRLTQARYQSAAEAQQARQEAEQWRRQVDEIRQQYGQQEQPQQQPQVDPVVLAKHIATVERVTERSNSIAKDGKARFPDFDQALATVREEAGSLFTQHGLPTPLGEAVLEADKPADLLHYLGTNPDVASELSGLSPVQLVRKLARIEQQMLAESEPKQSSAPKPVAPVRSVSRDDGTSLRDDLPIDEWTKRFRERMAKR